ncbi:MAG: lipoprotein signal peptidase [Bacteroidales bacterium]|nr:lipoprotein signal peptidase [Bacteroidales bacterium]
MSNTTKAILIILVICIIDQVIKILIKTSMVMGQEINVIGNWFILHFTENNGMAFGMDIPGRFGKFILSLFRILAVVGIGFYLRFLIKKLAPFGLVLSVSLILAGAIGNILDSAFYGLIFTDSWGQVAQMFPEGGGYAGFLHGRVVDIFYFPIIRGTWPDWLPFWGGQELIFFRPVFNIADSSITVGVITILFFQRKFFRALEENDKREKEVSESDQEVPEVVVSDSDPEDSGRNDL